MLLLTHSIDLGTDHLDKLSLAAHKLVGDVVLGKELIELCGAKGRGLEVTAEVCAQTLRSSCPDGSQLARGAQHGETSHEPSAFSGSNTFRFPRRMGVADFHLVVCVMKNKSGRPELRMQCLSKEVIWFRKRSGETLAPLSGGDAEALVNSGCQIRVGDQGCFEFIVAVADLERYAGLLCEYMHSQGVWGGIAPIAQAMGGKRKCSCAGDRSSSRRRRKREQSATSGVHTDMLLASESCGSSGGSSKRREEGGSSEKLKV